jgi:hypothetical protein
LIKNAGMDKKIKADGMNKSFKKLVEKFDALVKRINIGRNSSESTKCQFCGETGHDADNCPKASKYKLFNVDRD